MSFYAQHQRKCYCNSSTCSCRGGEGGGGGGPTQTTTTTPPIKHTLSSLSKSKKDKNNCEKFVKIRSYGSNANGRGLGHSHNVGGGITGSRNQNHNNFSRRNSAATTTSTATRTTLNSETMLTTNTAASNKSGRGDGSNGRRKSGSGSGSGYSDFTASATTTPTTNSSKYELTASRKYYERCKEATAAAHNDIIGAWTSSSGNSASTLSTAPIVGERIYALQQWRIQNPDDCFSVHRQNDLKMQQRLKEANLSSASFGNTFCVSLKPRQNNVAEQQSSSQPSLHKAKNVDLKTLTPYAVRQKLLQLRLQAEDIAAHRPGPARGQKQQGQKWSYGGVDKSCALRFQETY